jgi:predicted PurR-regulated permease PerM
MEEATSLHRALVIVTVTALGPTFGILGPLLAVPAAVVAAILVRELWFEWLEDGNEIVNEEEKGEGS